VYSNIGAFVLAIDANNGNIIWTSTSSGPHPGGVSFQYNYPSVAIGQNEIVSVHPQTNSIVVYCMPSATQSATISPTASITLTETITPTPTVSFTNTQTQTYTTTPSEVLTYTCTATPSITITTTTTPIPSATATLDTPRLYPNPHNPDKETATLLYAFDANADTANIKIYTVACRLVKDIKINKSQIAMINANGNKTPIDCQGFSTGIYYYIIMTNKKSIQTRNATGEMIILK
jgi:hypothetical protein